MENNRLLKKFNTCFWYCLYALPLIILLLTFIGYFTLYKEKGDLIYYDSELIEVVDTVDTNVKYGFTGVSNSGFVDNIYFDTSKDFSYFEMLSIELGHGQLFYILCSSGHKIALRFLDYGNDLIIMLYDEIDNHENVLYVSSSSSTLLDGFRNDLGFVGWNFDLINLDGSYVIGEEVWSTLFGTDGGVPVGEFNSSFSFVSSTKLTSIFVDNYSYYNSSDNSLIEPIGYEKTSFEEDTSYNAIYFNLSLPLEFYNSQFSNLSFDSDGCCHLSPFLIVINYGDGYLLMDLFNMLILFNSSQSAFDDGFSDFFGWNKDFLGACASGDISSVDSYDSLNSLEFVSSKSFKPIVEFVSSRYHFQFDNGSLFDYSLRHTVNSFDDFTLPILENGLNNTFNLIGININNNISNFIVMLFAWFIELMILHIMIDLLIFLPRLFHNYMERWL